MSEEIQARNKFTCPACGAEAVWNPGKHELCCPYCGTESPAELATDGALIQEHDLVKFLRDAPESARGWKSERRSVKCQSCKAISVLRPEVVGQRCEFCGSAQIVPYEQIKPPISPESLLPFTIADSQARDNVRTWLGSHWFAPNRLKRAALIDTLHGVYIPYWTFDANVRADWTAMSGYHYYVTETYRDSEGRSQTRQVQKTRWEPSEGTINHVFDDQLVTGSVGIPEELLRAIEPFPTAQLVPYDPGYVAGWVVEQYQVDLAGAAQTSRQRMDEEVYSLCGSDVPGDTHRDLQVSSDYSALTFKHILVPVWLLTYDYGSRSFSVAINGVTGKLSGQYPLSWIKVTLAVLVGLAILLWVLAYVKG